MNEGRKSIVGGYHYTNKINRNKRFSIDSFRTGSTLPFLAGQNQTLPDECPLNRETLGQIGWAFLHTTCAFYPDSPSPDEKYAMAQFIFLFARFYPCRLCGESFLRHLNSNPPDVTNNVTLNRWVCQAHNSVNAKLGKPLYDCSKNMERWRFGWSDGSCLQPTRN